MAQVSAGTPASERSVEKRTKFVPRSTRAGEKLSGKHAILLDDRFCCRLLCRSGCLSRLSRSACTPELGYQWLYAGMAGALPQGSRRRRFHRSEPVIGKGIVM